LSAKHLPVARALIAQARRAHLQSKLVNQLIYLCRLFSATRVTRLPKRRWEPGDAMPFAVSVVCFLPAKYNCPNEADNNLDTLFSCTDTLLFRVAPSRSPRGLAVCSCGRGWSMFAVFDGHGGTEVSKFCARYMPKMIVDLQAYRKGDMVRPKISVVIFVMVFEHMVRETCHQ
jgi:hypothetical protein